MSSPTNRSYLDELLKELQAMTSLTEQQGVRISQSLLLREIQRVWESELTSSEGADSGIKLRSMIGRLQMNSDEGSPSRSPGDSRSPSRMEGKVEKTEKLFFPPESPENKNPVGRLIGPRGMTIRQFEKDFGCRLNIRGKGCTKNDAKEERLRGRPGWEHLNEPIHVQLTAHGDTEQACAQKLAHIKSRLSAFLETTDTALKRAQLVQLAVIEGTLK